MISDKIPEKIVSYQERTKEIIRKTKKVYQYNMEGYYLREFDSANEINQQIGANVNHLRECCLGKLKSYLGYRWSYEKVNRLQPLKRNAKSIPIVQFDKDWNYIKEWVSATEIKEALNIDQSSVGRCCKGKQETAGGYKWKYKSDCV